MARLSLAAGSTLALALARGDKDLAMAVSGQGIQVVNLTGGRVRWQRRIAASPALTAVGGMVIYGLNGHLTGYDSRPGRPRWVIAPGMSPDPAFQCSAASSWSPATPPALRYRTPDRRVPATGHVAWRFLPFTPAPASSSPRGRTTWRWSPATW